MNFLNNTSSLLLVLLLLLFANPFETEALQNSQSDTLKQHVTEGRKLFTGQNRLTNGGPACISCHTFNDPELSISGGTLAVNVTGFAGLPVEALKQRILEISLPHMTIMKAAYANQLVTEEEASSIISYLKQVSGQAASSTNPMMAGLNFLWAGLITFIVLLGIIWISWRSRKKGSVNEEIYKRQIQSI